MLSTQGYQNNVVNINRRQSQLSAGPERDIIAVNL